MAECSFQEKVFPENCILFSFFQNGSFFRKTNHSGKMRKVAASQNTMNLVSDCKCDISKLILWSRDSTSSLVNHALVICTVDFVGQLLVKVTCPLLIIYISVIRCDGKMFFLFPMFFKIDIFNKIENYLCHMCIGKSRLTIGCARKIKKTVLLKWSYQLWIHIWKSSYLVECPWPTTLINNYK